MMDWSELFNIQIVISFLLILFRVMGVFLAAPLLGNQSIPVTVKLAISIILSLLVLPYAKVESPLLVSSSLYLIQCILIEVSIGVMIGFAAAILFAAIQSAGEFIGMKIGYSIATVIDPSNSGSSGIIGSLFVLLGGVIFLYLNGHHVILKTLVDSFRLIPLTHGFDLSSGLQLGAFVSKILITGIKIAAPVLIVITLLNLSFGFITKLSPQMNIYFNIGFIVGPILGILTLMLSLPLFRVLVMNLTTELEPDLIQLVRQLKGV
jgi:flagellar biosynthetic protein FliR